MTVTWSRSDSSTAPWKARRGHRPAVNLLDARGRDHRRRPRRPLRRAVSAADRTPDAEARVLRGAPADVVLAELATSAGRSALRCSCPTRAMPLAPAWSGTRELTLSRCAARHGRTRADGRQHRAAVGPRRLRGRVRRRPGGDRRAVDDGYRADSLDGLRRRARAPTGRVVMVLAGEITEATVTDLAARLEHGDAIIDGNSYYRDDIRRPRRWPNGGSTTSTVARAVAFKPERGYYQMIGGRTRPWADSSRSSRRSRPAWTRAARTPGRSGDPPAEHGYLHCGPSGAGHFVKMVHNGIEYDSWLPTRRASTSSATPTPAPIRGKDAGDHRAARPPRALSLRNRRHRGGGGLAARERRSAPGCSTSPQPRCRSRPAWTTSPGASRTPARGCWTSIAAIEEVPAPVLSAALYSRFASRGLDDFGNSALGDANSSSAATRRSRAERPSGACDRGPRRRGFGRRPRRRADCRSRCSGDRGAGRVPHSRSAAATRRGGWSCSMPRRWPATQ